MNPTNHNTPSGSHGSAPTKPHLDTPSAGTEPGSKPAGATSDDHKQKTSAGIQAVLDSGKQTLEGSKNWLESTDLADKAKELPQRAKDLGSQALTKVNGLTTTQKAVGVGLLAAGVAYLVVRGKKHKDDGEHRLKSRRSPFAKKSNKEDDKGSPRAQQRPWGTSRYGSAAAPASAGKDRVTAGSGPKPGHPDHQRDQGQRPTPPAGGQRRDQGPASGSRYDAKTSGGQNPNNLDQLNSAF
jgi:hypothetical protein